MVRTIWYELDYKTFWWWWTLRALVMIHRSEASMVWMQKPELSQMRITLRAIWLSDTWSELDIKWHVFKSTFEAPDTSVNMTMRWTSHSWTIAQKLCTVFAIGPWATVSENSVFNMGKVLLQWNPVISKWKPVLRCRIFENLQRSQICDWRR